MSRPSLVASLAILFLAGCGAAPTRRGPDESREPGGSGRVVTMPGGLDGTQWRWVEAHCTEGPLDLASRGFAQELRIQDLGTHLRMTYDQAFGAEGCSQTVIQTITSPSTPGELLTEEVARVAVPANNACYGRPEAPRPGEVRRAREKLEVLVQRSNWCNGFEVRMVYAPAQLGPLDDAEIVRHYVAAFSAGDVDRVMELFAPTASLLEPFTTTETGDPFRHEGRDAVRGWYDETIASAPWRAMRVVGLEPNQQPGTVGFEFEYMDPRLAQPLRGRTRLTVAGGEIFEADIELLDVPMLVPNAPAPAQGS